MTADSGPDPCPHCEANDAEKLVSRFQRGRTEDDRMDEMADRIEGMGEPDSPREMRELMREMGSAMDDDMSDEMEAMFEADMAENGDDE